MSVIISKAWKAKKTGSIVKYNGVEYTIGSDAFASTTDAVKAGYSSDFILLDKSLSSPVNKTEITSAATGIFESTTSESISKNEKIEKISSSFNASADGSATVKNTIEPLAGFKDVTISGTSSATVSAVARGGSQKRSYSKKTVRKDANDDSNATISTSAELTSNASGKATLSKGSFKLDSIEDANSDTKASDEVQRVLSVLDLGDAQTINNAASYDTVTVSEGSVDGLNGGKNTVKVSSSNKYSEDVEISADYSYSNTRNASGSAELKKASADGISGFSKVTVSGNGADVSTGNITAGNNSYTASKNIAYTEEKSASSTSNTSVSNSAAGSAKITGKSGTPAAAGNITGYKTVDLSYATAGNIAAAETVAVTNFADMKANKASEKETLSITYDKKSGENNYSKEVSTSASFKNDGTLTAKESVIAGTIDGYKNVTMDLKADSGVTSISAADVSKSKTTKLTGIVSDLSITATEPTGDDIRSNSVKTSASTSVTGELKLTAKTAGVTSTASASGFKTVTLTGKNGETLAGAIDSVTSSESTDMSKSFTPDSKVSYSESSKVSKDSNATVTVKKAAAGAISGAKTVSLTDAAAGAISGGSSSSSESISLNVNVKNDENNLSYSYSSSSSDKVAGSVTASKSTTAGASGFETVDLKEAKAAAGSDYSAATKSTSTKISQSGIVSELKNTADVAGYIDNDTKKVTVDTTHSFSYSKTDETKNNVSGKTFTLKEKDATASETVNVAGFKTVTLDNTTSGMTLSAAVSNDQSTSKTSDAESFTEEKSYSTNESSDSTSTATGDVTATNYVALTDLSGIKSVKITGKSAETKPNTSVSGTFGQDTKKSSSNSLSVSKSGDDTKATWKEQSNDKTTTVATLTATNAAVGTVSNLKTATLTDSTATSISGAANSTETSSVTKSWNSDLGIVASEDEYAKELVALTPASENVTTWNVESSDNTTYSGTLTAKFKKAEDGNTLGTISGFKSVNITNAFNLDDDGDEAVAATIGGETYTSESKSTKRSVSSSKRTTTVKDSLTTYADGSLTVTGAKNDGKYTTVKLAGELSNISLTDAKATGDATTGKTVTSKKVSESVSFKDGSVSSAKLSYDQTSTTTANGKFSATFKNATEAVTALNGSLTGYGVSVTDINMGSATSGDSYGDEITAVLPKTEFFDYLGDDKTDAVTLNGNISGSFSQNGDAITADWTASKGNKVSGSYSQKGENYALTAGTITNYNTVDLKNVTATAVTNNVADTTETVKYVTNKSGDVTTDSDVKVVSTGISSGTLSATAAKTKKSVYTAASVGTISGVETVKLTNVSNTSAANSNKIVTTATDNVVEDAYNTVVTENSFASGSFTASNDSDWLKNAGTAATIGTVKGFNTVSLTNIDAGALTGGSETTITGDDADAGYTNAATGSVTATATYTPSGAELANVNKIAGDISGFDTVSLNNITLAYDEKVGNITADNSSKYTAKDGCVTVSFSGAKSARVAAASNVKNAAYSATTGWSGIYVNDVKVGNITGYNTVELKNVTSVGAIKNGSFYADYAGSYAYGSGTFEKNAETGYKTASYAASGSVTISADTVTKSSVTTSVVTTEVGGNINGFKTVKLANVAFNGSEITAAARSIAESEDATLTVYGATSGSSLTLNKVTIADTPAISGFDSITLTEVSGKLGDIKGGFKSNYSDSYTLKTNSKTFDASSSLNDISVIGDISNYAAVKVASAADNDQYIGTITGGYDKYSSEEVKSYLEGNVELTANGYQTITVEEDDVALRFNQFVEGISQVKKVTTAGKGRVVIENINSVVTDSGDSFTLDAKAGTTIRSFTGTEKADSFTFKAAGADDLNFLFIDEMNFGDGDDKITLANNVILNFYTSTYTNYATVDEAAAAIAATGIEKLSADLNAKATINIASNGVFTKTEEITSYSDALKAALKDNYGVAVANDITFVAVDITLNPTKVIQLPNTIPAYSGTDAAEQIQIYKDDTDTFSANINTCGGNDILSFGKYEDETATVQNMNWDVSKTVSFGTGKDIVSTYVWRNPDADAEEVTTQKTAAVSTVTLKNADALAVYADNTALEAAFYAMNAETFEGNFKFATSANAAQYLTANGVSALYTAEDEISDVSAEYAAEGYNTNLKFSADAAVLTIKEGDFTDMSGFDTVNFSTADSYITADSITAAKRTAAGINSATVNNLESTAAFTGTITNKFDDEAMDITAVNATADINGHDVELSAGTLSADYFTSVNFGDDVNKVNGKITNATRVNGDVATVKSLVGITTETFTGTVKDPIVSIDAVNATVTDYDVDSITLSAGTLTAINDTAIKTVNFTSADDNVTVTENSITAASAIFYWAEVGTNEFTLTGKAAAAYTLDSAYTRVGNYNPNDDDAKVTAKITADTDVTLTKGYAHFYNVDKVVINGHGTVEAADIKYANQATGAVSNVSGDYTLTGFTGTVNSKVTATDATAKVNEGDAIVNELTAGTLSADYFTEVTYVAGDKLSGTITKAASDKTATVKNNTVMTFASANTITATVGSATVASKNATVTVDGTKATLTAGSADFTGITEVVTNGTVKFTTITAADMENVTATGDYTLVGYTGKVNDKVTAVNADATVMEGDAVVSSLKAGTLTGNFTEVDFSSENTVTATKDGAAAITVATAANHVVTAMEATHVAVKGDPQVSVSKGTLTGTFCADIEGAKITVTDGAVTIDNTSFTTGSFGAGTVTSSTGMIESVDKDTTKITAKGNLTLVNYHGKVNDVDASHANAVISSNNKVVTSLTAGILEGDFTEVTFSDGNYVTADAITRADATGKLVTANDATEVEVAGAAKVKVANGTLSGDFGATIDEATITVTSGAATIADGTFTKAGFNGGTVTGTGFTSVDMTNTSIEAATVTAMDNFSGITKGMTGFAASATFSGTEVDMTAGKISGLNATKVTFGTDSVIGAVTAADFDSTAAVVTGEFTLAGETAMVTDDLDEGTWTVTGNGVKASVTGTTATVKAGTATFSGITAVTATGTVTAVTETEISGATTEEVYASSIAKIEGYTGNLKENAEDTEYVKATLASATFSEGDKTLVASFTAGTLEAKGDSYYIFSVTFGDAKGTLTADITKVEAGTDKYTATFSSYTATEATEMFKGKSGTAYDFTVTDEFASAKLEFNDQNDTLELNGGELTIDFVNFGDGNDTLELDANLTLVKNEDGDAFTSITEFAQAIKNSGVENLTGINGTRTITADVTSSSLTFDQDVKTALGSDVTCTNITFTKA